MTCNPLFHRIEKCSAWQTTALYLYPNGHTCGIYALYFVLCALVIYDGVLQ